MEHRADNEVRSVSGRPTTEAERVQLADDYQALFPEDHAHSHWCSCMERLREEST